VLVPLLVLALVVWVVLIVIGFVIKALFWLGIVGIVLFIVTAGIGMGKLLKA
jgi:hypothetical protein